MKIRENSRRTSIKVYALALLCCTVTGCSSYRAAPLPERPKLSPTYTSILIDRQKMDLPALAAHPFNASGRLDMDDVAILAVLNSPDLRLARADARIAHAQAFSAGLLPDPQISLTRDFPTNGQAGSTSAFNFNISEDINALLRHHFDSQAAQADTHKTNLDLLWQEWQVIAQARTLYVRLVYGQEVKTLLQAHQKLANDRYQRSQLALKKGLVTVDALALDLATLQDLNRQLSDQERQINADTHDLHHLLGLSPSAELPLQTLASPLTEDETRTTAALADITRRRADLLALQQGYRAEDARYRAALLGQFPSFNIGFTRARDTSGVYTHGFGITLSLPIFNGNRGNIAIEEATRAKLQEDYQARINTAANDVHRIVMEQGLNRQQLQEAEKSLGIMQQAVQNAQTAFSARILDALTLNNLQAASLAKQLECINLQQAIWLQHIALLTLLGGELPPQTKR